MRRAGRLNVLVVGTEAWAMDRAVRALQHAGHRVVQCPAAEWADDGCEVLDGSTCELDDHLDVVLSVRARPLDRVVRSEYGAVCALRRGVPLVVAGSAASSPFAAFAVSDVDLDGDVVAACVGAAASGPRPLPQAALDELELLVRGRAQPLQPIRGQTIADPPPVHRHRVAR